MTLDLFQLIGGEHHVPDILECFANLSSNEIPTSPELTNRILDLLPEDVWSDPTLRWLEPSATTGVFLREAAARLMVGLEPSIPNEDERREHILRNMLFGIAQTALSAEIARRSLYYSRDASSDHSVVRFDNPEGNIAFEQGKHTFANGKCCVCGALEELERGNALENYSYSFIHMTSEEKEDTKMKFDVIVGNPPYQLDDGGHGASAAPIYHLFVKQAIELAPRYITMIIPSRWFAGGKGLDTFRKEMLDDKHLDVLVDYPDATECFPGVVIKGGVCYFLRDREADNTSKGCAITTVRKGKQSPTVRRKLDGYDVLIRENESVSILEKVKVEGLPTVSACVASRKPFGLPTNFTDFTNTPTQDDDVKLYARGCVGWVAREKVQKNTAWIDKWKVLTPMAATGDGRIPNAVLAKPIVAAPGSCCTETYLVMKTFDTEEEAEHFATYLKTRMFRFLVSLRKNTQHLNRDRFRFVPDLPINQTWTDEELYKRYNLTPDEISFIEGNVKAMP